MPKTDLNGHIEKMIEKDSIANKIKEIYLEGNKAYISEKLELALQLYNQFIKIAKLNNKEQLLWQEIRISLSYISSIYISQSNIEKSTNFLKRALEITLKYEPIDYINSYFFLFKIAKNYYKQNDFPNALEYYDQAKSILSTSNEIPLTDKALLYNNIGLCYLKLGIDNQSQKYLEESLKILLELGEQGNIAICYENIGLVEQSKKKYTEALDSFKRSLAKYESLNNNDEIAFLENNIGNLYLEKESYDTCKYYYEKSLEVRKKSPNTSPQDLVQSYNNVAYINLKKQNIDSALINNKLAFNHNLKNQNSESAIGNYSTPDYLISVADRIEINSKVFEQTKNPEVLIESHQLFLNTIRIMLNQIRNFNSIFAPNLYLNKNKRIFDASILSAFKLDSVIKSDFPKTIIISEIFKGLSLLNYPSEIRNLQSGSMSKSIAGYYKNYYQLQSMLTANDGFSVDSINVATIDSLISNSLKIDFQKQCSLETLSNNITRYYETIQDSLTYSTQHISGERILVDYYMTSNTLFIHTITDSKVICKAVPINDILREAIMHYPISIISMDLSTTTTLGRIISNSLLDPIMENLADYRKIVFIPDEGLAGIPLETLSVITQPTLVSHYLIENKDISYRFSILNRNYSQLPITRNHEVDFFGIAPFSVEDYPSNNLSGSAREIFEINLLYIKNSLKSKSFIGKEATYENLINGPVSSRVMHLSTHSDINKLNSNFSFLELFNSNSESSLYFPVLSSIPFNNDLMILNACDSGKNMVSSSTGFVSFLRGLLNNSTQNYICTLWKIYDEPSYYFIKGFYDNLLKGNSYNKSLALAKRNFIKSKTYNDPIFWSSFILYENN